MNWNIGLWKWARLKNTITNDCKLRYYRSIFRYTYISSAPQKCNFFSYLIIYDCIGHMKGTFLCGNWHINYLSKTVIIRITNQGVLTKCSSFQISHLIVTCTLEFTLFLGHLQPDHPLTCKNVKCYSHVQIIHWIKSFYNLLPLIMLQKINYV